jgi:tetratricopeptide (TPR) repeat protein
MLVIQSLNFVIAWPFKELIQQHELLNNLFSIFPYFHLLYFINAIRTFRISGKLNSPALMLSSDPVYARYKVLQASEKLSNLPLEEPITKDEPLESDDTSVVNISTSQDILESDCHEALTSDQDSPGYLASTESSVDAEPATHSSDDGTEQDYVVSEVTTGGHNEAPEINTQMLPDRFRIPIVSIYKPKFESDSYLISKAKNEYVETEVKRSEFTKWLRQVTKTDDQILNQDISSMDNEKKQKKKKKKKKKKHDFNQTIIDSLIDHDYLVSEQYADLLYQQGYLDKAIAIYERLLKEKPENYAIFASKIELIKKDKI